MQKKKIDVVFIASKIWNKFKTFLNIMDTWLRIWRRTKDFNRLCFNSLKLRESACKWQPWWWWRWNYHLMILDNSSCVKLSISESIWGLWVRKSLVIIPLFVTNNLKKKHITIWFWVCNVWVKKKNQIDFIWLVLLGC